MMYAIRRARVCVVTLAMCGVVATAVGQGGDIQWEAAVDVDTTASSSRPDMALGSDALHMVWGSGADTLYERSTDNGLTWGDPHMFSFQGLAARHRIAADGIRVVVSWTDQPVTSTYEVQMSYSSDSGLAWSTPQALFSGSVADTTAIGSFVSGSDVVILWRVRAATVEYRLRVSHDGGASWQPERFVASAPAAGVTSGEGDVAIVGDDLVVLYSDNAGVYVLRSSDWGVTWGAPTALASGSDAFGVRDLAVEGSTVLAHWGKFIASFVDEQYVAHSGDSAVSWGTPVEVSAGLSGTNPSASGGVAIRGQFAVVAWSYRTGSSGDLETAWVESVNGGETWTSAPQRRGTVEYAQAVTADGEYVYIAYNTTGTQGAYLLRGTYTAVVAPGVSVDPSPIAFGDVTVGSSADQTFTIASTGTATLTISDITSDNAAFTIALATQTLPFDLAAEDPDLTEIVTVTFSPTVEGAQTANITITHSAAGSPTVVSISSAGVPPTPTIAVSAPTAGEVLAAGTTSTPITVAITDHPSPGRWHWQLNTPFPDTGTATGTPVAAGTLTDTIPGLVNGTSYTVYVALVVDETHALVDATTNAASRASVTFSVDSGGPAVDAVTVVDAQGSAGSDVFIAIDIYDTLAAGYSVTGIDLTVTYDPAILTPATNAGDTIAAAITDLTTGWSIAQNVVTPGELEIVMAAEFVAELAAGGTLLELTFGVDAAAVTNTTTPVGLSRALLNEGLVPSTAAAGTFTVVNFKFGDVTGNGTWSGYDASHVLEHVARELADGSHHTFPVEITAPVWAPLPLTHEEAETVANVGGETKPDPDGGADPVPDITAMDGSLILQRAVSIITIYPVEGPAAPAAAPITVVAPLTASSTSNRPGARVTVTLDTSAIPDLRAGELVLEFDEALLRPVDVSMRRGATDDDAPTPLMMQRHDGGRLAVVFASARPIGGNGARLEITFEAARNVTQPTASEVRASHLRLNASRVDTDFAFRFRIQPFQTRLMANYPNPFNPETWIPFELAEDADVTVRLYGLDGRVVRTLDLGRRAMGEHAERDQAAYWDGRNDAGERVASGVYVYELDTAASRVMRRLVISK